MKYIKFSKPSKDMKDIRKSFFSENKKFLKKAKRANTFYSKQKTNSVTSDVFKILLLLYTNAAFALKNCHIFIIVQA